MMSEGFLVEGCYVPRLAELGVLCMPAFFVTYQGPQGLMQDCLRYWAESQYWCQKWDVNHSWLGPVLNLDSVIGCLEFPCHTVRYDHCSGADPII